MKCLKAYWPAVLLVVFGAGILLVPAVWNGFPFVFDDSADYLVFTPRIYRSPFYGLFLFFFHLNRWIWLGVIAQSLILSHLMWTWTRLLLPAQAYRAFIPCVVILTGVSSLPFMVGFLMADALTAVVVLAVGLLAFHYADLSSGERLYLFLLLCVGIVAHVSHLALTIGLLVTVVVIYVIQGRAYIRVRMPLLLLAAATALSVSAISLNNAVIHRTFAVSPGGSSFVMTNWIEYGPARRYLEDACPQAGYRICAHLEEMPETVFEILWRTEFYARLGGFEGMRDEASRIVAETIRTRPGDVLTMALRLVAAAAVTHAPGAELGPVGNSIWLENTLAKRFGPTTLEAWLASAQRNRQIPRDVLKAIDQVVFPVSLIVVLAGAVAAAWYRWANMLGFSILVLSSVAGNAILCAVGSGVYDRYQARVTWLVPFAALLFLAMAADALCSRKTKDDLRLAPFKLRG